MSKQQDVVTKVSHVLWDPGDCDNSGLGGCDKDDTSDGNDDDAPLIEWTTQLYDDDTSSGKDDDVYVPASGVAMACLKEATMQNTEEEKEEGGECAVCLESYEAGDVLRTMPCSRGFHETCIFGWLRVSRFCPLCCLALPASESAG